MAALPASATAVLRGTASTTSAPPDRVEESWPARVPRGSATTGAASVATSARPSAGSVATTSTRSPTRSSRTAPASAIRTGAATSDG